MTETDPKSGLCPIEFQIVCQCSHCKTCDGDSCIAAGSADDAAAMARTEGWEFRADVGWLCPECK